MYVCTYVCVCVCVCVYVMCVYVQRVHVSTLLKDATVTDMLWDSKSSRLFFGDDQGRIAVSYMPKVRKELMITELSEMHVIFSPTESLQEAR